MFIYVSREGIALVEQFQRKMQFTSIEVANAGEIILNIFDFNSLVMLTTALGLSQIYFTGMHKYRNVTDNAKNCLV